MLAKLVFKIGQYFRNPSLKGWSLFLKNSNKIIDNYDFIFL